MAYVDRSTRLGLAWLGYAGGLGIEQNSFGPFSPPKTVVLAPGVASAAAVGTPTLVETQGVVLAPGPIGRQAPGTPTLLGGTTQLRIWIGGVERTNYLTWTESATGQSSGAVGSSAATAQGTVLTSTTRGRWQLTFSLYLATGPGTWGPARGQSVLLTDFGRRLFFGYLVEVDVARQLSTASQIFFNCTATDLTSICDHRIVTQASYPAGTDVADVFRDIITTYLNGEAISAGLLPDTIGATSSALQFNYVTVTQALDQATTLIVATWWVDSFSNMNLALLVDCPVCPFALSETSYNWRNLVAAYSMLDYRNTQYVRSNLSTLPAGQGFTYTYTVDQPAAVALGLYQGSAVLPFPIASVISITLDGVPQIYADASDPQVYDPGNPNYGKVWFSFPPLPYLSPPGSNSLGIGTLPPIGSTVVIQYIPATTSGTGSQSTGSSVGVEAAVPFQPVPLPGNTPQNGESFQPPGSGIWENVEQVNDLTNIDDLNAIAAAMLNRYADEAPVVTFETDVPGAAVGQLLSVNVPLAYLPSQQLLITALRGTCQDVNLLQHNPALAFDGLGSSFRWEVTAGPDIGDWVKWFESLIGLTQHPNPVIRIATPQFGLALGGSLAAGLAASNPLVLQNTGKLVSAFAVAGVPPFNQDLYLDILSANLGGNSILKSPIRIGSNNGNQVVVTNFVTAYLFAGDTLTARVSYVGIGGAPQAAGSVTLGCVLEF